MTEADRIYARLCCAVWCAGILIWQERMDGWLAGFEPRRS